MAEKDYKEQPQANISVESPLETGKTFQQPRNEKKSHDVKRGWGVSMTRAIYDLVEVNYALLYTVYLRHGSQFSKINPSFLQIKMHCSPIYTVIFLVLFFCLDLCNSIWYYASYTELIRVIQPLLITAIFYIAAIVKTYLAGQFGTKPDYVNTNAASSFYAMDRNASFIKEWKAGLKDGFVIDYRDMISNAIHQCSNLRGENVVSTLCCCFAMNMSRLKSRSRRWPPICT